jgi:hypothetical protein
MSDQQCPRVRFYLSMNLIGKDACWCPMFRDSPMVCIPRIGESVLIGDQSHGEQTPVIDVVHSESGVVIVELEGDEWKDDREEFECSVEFYQKLGFIIGLPD